MEAETPKQEQTKEEAPMKQQQMKQRKKILSSSNWFFKKRASMGMWNPRLAFALVSGLILSCLALGCIKLGSEDVGDGEEKGKRGRLPLCLCGRRSRIGQKRCRKHTKMRLLRPLPRRLDPESRACKDVFNYIAVGDNGTILRSRQT